MKYNFRQILTVATIAASGLFASAEKCEIALGVLFTDDGDKVPAAVTRTLETKLRTILTHTGVAAGDYDCQFFITGRFDGQYSQQSAGPGGKILLKTNLQLAICDAYNKKVYATVSLPLKGTGVSDEQAYIKAMTQLNGKNPQFITFVDNAKDKIVDYFNNNYQNYLSKAQTALKARNYDEALYWATSVPECCTGFPEARKLALSIYTDRTNYDSAMLLAKAQGEWAADPTSSGAAKAFQYLSQIDPSAACYAEAQALGKKIADTVKADYDFETKTKYQNEIDLERRRIESARQIGLAWAQNQPKTIVKYNWIIW